MCHGGYAVLLGKDKGRGGGQAQHATAALQGGHVALLHWHDHLLRHDTADYTVSMMQYFREKIKAEAEGRPYTPPPPSKATSGAARPPACGMTRNSRSFGNSGWDDWGDGGGAGGGSRPVKVRSAVLPRNVDVRKVYGPSLANMTRTSRSSVNSGWDDWGNGFQY